MRILFIGAVSFYAQALRELISMRVNVVGVCTLRESEFNSDHEDLTPIAKQAGIPVRYTPKVNNECLRLIESGRDYASLPIISMRSASQLHNSIIFK